VSNSRGSVQSAGIQDTNSNFELVFSRLYKDATNSDVREQIERAIYDYFDAMELPDTPTLYDHLVLSLRQNDIIATFNWDPFLIQALQKTFQIHQGLVPKLLFLHGNVLSGFCLQDKVHGKKGASCSKCKQPFSASKLLYPIEAKNYDNDPMISGSWDHLRQEMQNAAMFTIFGYSAPTSDKSAKAILRKAWKSNSASELNEVEFIDIKSEKEIENTWRRFTFSHHYKIHMNFYQSWIAKHPRRTIEVY